ncbi:MAG TPA: HD domain-containing protein [bacterium]|nr:HD domain-containing protein [bacterium]
MKVRDRIYGEFEVGPAVIRELVESRPFQRLRGVNQYGGVDLVFPGRYQVTRFEHSLGVWRVLEKVGASPEIQVAGLLHDLGHTAFSHMVDMAMASSGEDYHEKNMHLIEGLDEVSEILKRHGIAPPEADGCPEIKKSLPDVGADRIDYGVRDFVGATGLEPGLGREVLENILLIGRDIVFTDAGVARRYALAALEAMWLCIYEPSVACVYQALTEIIRIGWEGGWIGEKDLFGDDASLFARISAHGSELPEKHYRLFTTPFEVEEAGEDDCDFKHVKLKVRYFDPPVLSGGVPRPLSDLDPGFVEKLEPMKLKFEERKKGACFKVRFART